MNNMNFSSLCSSDICEHINIYNVYIPSFTLVSLRNGCISFTDEKKRTISCDAPGIIALERDQFVDILLQEVEGHLAFDVLEIPHSILTQVYELIVEKLRAEADANKTTYRIVYSKDFNIEKDIFDSLKKLLTAEEKTMFPANGDAVDVSVYYLLLLISGFISDNSFSGIISRSVSQSLKYKVYNLIYAEPSRQWRLDDVSAAIFMSTSTLKRKLATEGTTFSELYITARMNLACKLLRTGKHNVTSVAVLCGYDSVSYFISCFKKQFNITPSAFMKSMNH